MLARVGSLLQECTWNMELFWMVILMMAGFEQGSFRKIIAKKNPTLPLHKKKVNDERFRIEPIALGNSIPLIRCFQGPYSWGYGKATTHWWSLPAGSGPTLIPWRKHYLRIVTLPLPHKYEPRILSVGVRCKGGYVHANPWGTKEQYLDIYHAISERKKSSTKWKTFCTARYTVLIQQEDA